MAEVEQRVAFVAHELKGPLALMRQLALSVDMEPDLSGAQELSRQIVQTSERAMRQVEDLTRVARLEDALFELEPVNPRVICDQVAGELWQMFHFNKRELSFRYQNQSSLVVANRQLLFSVVYNFCLNAMKYSGEALPSIISIYDRKGLVRIEVRDFGPTVPTALWRELKQGLKGGPVKIAMRPGSSGLGLYIAARFAEYMQGVFGLVRHRDGTSFFVDLPVSKQLDMLRALA